MFAAGGIGAMVASFLLAGRGLPRRPLSVMYACWAAMCLQLVGYAVARSIWLVVLVTLLGTALLVYGQILWTTLLQMLVPRALLGRVASVDSLLSWGLTPISYALTAPVVDAVGLDATLVGAGSRRPPSSSSRGSPSRGSGPWRSPPSARLPLPELLSSVRKLALSHWF